MLACVVAMLEVICERWYFASSYCWLRADISFWAWASCDSMAAALALASEMDHRPPDAPERSTVPDNTVTTANTGTAIRWSTEMLLAGRGVEWLKTRSTSVTMPDILTGGLLVVQTSLVLHARFWSYRRYESRS